MKMSVVSRQSWGARTARALTLNALTKTSTLFVHWSAGRGEGIETKSEQAYTMRQIQNYHMDGHGWSDIGYSYVVFQPYGLLRRVRVFAGRSFRYVPAAQEGYNTGNGAVCVIMGPGDKLKRSTKRKLRGIFRRFPGEKLKGHRDVNPTSCPGDLLYASLPDIRAGNPPKKALLP